MYEVSERFYALEHEHSSIRKPSETVSIWMPKIAYKMRPSFGPIMSKT